MTTKREIDLYQYLANRRELLVDLEFARRLHIEGDALVEIVGAGIGPDALMPAEASGRFWFDKATLSNWRAWPWKASAEDIELAAEIVRKHDRALRIREYAAYDDDDARSFLIFAFERKRR